MIMYNQNKHLHIKYKKNNLFRNVKSLTSIDLPIINKLIIN